MRLLFGSATTLISPRFCLSFAACSTQVPRNLREQTVLVANFGDIIRRTQQFEADGANAILLMATAQYPSRSSSMSAAHAG
jgi:hypothetical protein